MKRFSRLLIVAFGFGVFGFVMLLVPQKTATGMGSAPVTVVNTVLPVEGTVGVSNFPATQAITGTVAVSSLPSVELGGVVTVGNPATNPVPVRDTDNPARHPFTVTCTSPNTNTTDTGCSGPVGGVPLGEEAVIEVVSVEATSDPANTFLLVQPVVTSGRSPYFLNLPPIQDSGLQQPGESFFRAEFQTRLYADQAQFLFCNFNTRLVNTTQPLAATCRFSGYLVTLP